MTTEKIYWDEDFGQAKLVLVDENEETNTVHYALEFKARHVFIYPKHSLEQENLRAFHDTAIAAYLERCAEDLQRLAHRIAHRDTNGTKYANH